MTPAENSLPLGWWLQIDAPEAYSSHDHWSSEFLAALRNSLRGQQGGRIASCDPVEHQAPALEAAAGRSSPWPSDCAIAQMHERHADPRHACSARRLSHKQMALSFIHNASKRRRVRSPSEAQREVRATDLP